MSQYPWMVITRPAEAPHKCELPSSNFDFRVGTVIECRTCFRRWRLTAFWLHRKWVDMTATGQS